MKKDQHQEAIPKEVLNRGKFPGFQNYFLNFKLNIPVILIRNVNLKQHLSNSTQMFITGIWDHTLCFPIITSCVCNTMFIAKISLNNEIQRGPFVPNKEMFKYCLCFWPGVGYMSLLKHLSSFSISFYLTINKAKRQSLSREDYLPHSVFGHGQPYVTISREKSVSGLTIGLVVFKLVLFVP
ncbi:hypothetical protein VP01_102g3 [Puccinia sorghi]|uniref:DNA helicase n=1 Tax=Puccinia sorghi TaxID=27349 RepID=A0A0L6VV07_9BASI|nr:hypothetical protein VP01_102g3 [Puccinia sorghi]